MARQLGAVSCTDMPIPLGGTTCVRIGQNLVCVAVYDHQLHCLRSCAMQMQIVQ